LCLNFVQGGECYATGGKCLLGSRGASASNRDGECELHGKFDVWVTEQNDLLITDMGFPSEEPKQCLALRVNEKLASRIAGEKARKFGSSVLTSQRRCFKCGSRYWVSQHKHDSGLQEFGHGYFCPDCNREDAAKDFGNELGALRYWCG
jgi:hypothetical protein